MSSQGNAADLKQETASTSPAASSTHPTAKTSSRSTSKPKGAKKKSSTAATATSASEDLSGAIASPESSTSATPSKDRQNRITVACERCRKRHKRCHGGQPCSNCVRSKAECIYVEGERKIVISLRYIQGIQSENSQLKTQLEEANAKLAALHQAPSSVEQQQTRHDVSLDSNLLPPINLPGNSALLNKRPPEQDPIRDLSTKRPHLNEPPVRMEHSTANRLPSPASLGLSRAAAIESLSETLNVENAFSTHQNPSEHLNQTFSQRGKGEGLNYFNVPDLKRAFSAIPAIMDQRPSEYQQLTSNLLPQPFNLNARPSHNQAQRSKLDESYKPSSTLSPSTDSLLQGNILPEPSIHLWRLPRPTAQPYAQRDGLNYNIKYSRLGQPVSTINFSLPPYEVALKCVESFQKYFIHFYFVNFGRFRHKMKQTYDDTRTYIPLANDDIAWFVTLLIVLGIGGMYQYTGEDGQPPRSFMTDKRSNQLYFTPQADFYATFHYLLSFIMDNLQMDYTSVEVLQALLLFSFYHYLMDMPLFHYFSSGLAYRYALALGIHSEKEIDDFSPHELEHRRRLWWTVYIVDRYISTKSGFPLSATSDSISVPDPSPIKITDPNIPDVFEDEGYLISFNRIAQITTTMLRFLYNRGLQTDVLTTITKVLKNLHRWRQILPENIRVDYSTPDLKVTRQIATIHFEYFQCINLAMRPILLYFVRKRIQATTNLGNSHNPTGGNETPQNSSRASSSSPPLSGQEPEGGTGPINLSKYSKEMLSLLSATFQSAIQTLRTQKKLLDDKELPLFSHHDRECIISSVTTLLVFNAAFGVNGLANSQISNGMTTLDLMAKIGNHSAEHQRDQIINLINAFDRAGIQSYQEDPSLKAQGAKIFSKSTTTASLPPLFSLFKPTEPNPAPSSNIPSGSSGINGAPGHYSTPTSASHGRLNNIGKNTLPPIPSLSSSSVDPKNNDQAYATNVSTPRETITPQNYSSISSNTSKKPSSGSGVNSIMNHTDSVIASPSIASLIPPIPLRSSSASANAPIFNEQTSQYQDNKGSVTPTNRTEIAGQQSQQGFTFDARALQNLELLGVIEKDATDNWGSTARFDNIELFPAESAFLSTNYNPPATNQVNNGNSDHPSDASKIQNAGIANSTPNQAFNDDENSIYHKNDAFSRSAGNESQHQHNGLDDFDFAFFDSKKPKAHLQPSNHPGYKPGTFQQNQPQYSSEGTHDINSPSNIQFVQPNPDDSYVRNLNIAAVQTPSQVLHQTNQIASHKFSKSGTKPHSDGQNLTIPIIDSQIHTPPIQQQLPNQPQPMPQSVPNLSESAPTNSQEGLNSPWWSQVEQEMWTELSTNAFSWHSLLAENVDEWRK